MVIAQKNDEIDASLAMTVYRDQRWDHVGTVRAEFDGQGKTTKVSVTTPEILDFLQADIPRGYFDAGWIDTYITNPDHSATVMDGVAGALGLERWGKLDLRLTAAGLYTALGVHDADSFSDALTFHG